MNPVAALFGLCTLLTLLVSWKRKEARGAAALLAAIWLLGEALSLANWDAQDAIGQGVNALCGAALVVWAFYGLRPLVRRARPVWWLLALSASFAAQNYLHMAEQGALLNDGGADPWRVWSIKHALWVQLCAINALQLAIVVGGPRADVLVRLFDRMLFDTAGRRNSGVAHIAREEAERQGAAPTTLVGGGRADALVLGLVRRVCLFRRTARRHAIR